MLTASSTVNCSAKLSADIDRKSNDCDDAEPQLLELSLSIHLKIKQNIN